MLKQQSTENQQQTIFTFVPSPVLQAQGTVNGAVHTGPRRRVAQPQRYTAPLSLSRRQALIAFGLPVLFVAYTVAMSQLPNAWNSSDVVVFLRVIGGLPLAITLCVGVGYLVRRLRLAVFFGAFAGFALELTRPVTQWLQHHHLDLSDPYLQFERHALLIFMLIGIVLTLIGAVTFQIRNGRHSFSDRDYDR